MLRPLQGNINFDETKYFFKPSAAPLSLSRRPV